jgi:tRNA pseudouridine55 synthase
MSAPPRNPTSGVLLVDKPAGITSHDVVARTRNFVGTRKVGHAGTLDPMATGLLVLGINNSTRLLTWVVGLDKEYTATIRLGASSTTDDADGELSPPASPAALAAVTDAALAEGIARLTGAISQRPSSVSAIKVDGKRAYTLAREGAEVVLEARNVTVSAFEVRDVRRGEWVDVDVRVECSSGTYIRALARDLGEFLGVGGHLTALRRTRIGPFGVDEAVAIGEEMVNEFVSPAAAATRLFTGLALSDEQAIDLAHGKRIPLPAGTGVHAAVAPDGRLVGLLDIVDGRARVLVNFPADVPATSEVTA